MNLCKEAMLAQGACNLGALVHGWARIMTQIQDEARKAGHGTAWINQHPVNVLFAEQVYHLAGNADPMAYARAYAACDALASGDLAPVFSHTLRPTTSPWGKPDSADEIAPGIWSVSTPSHGGYLISQERYDAMPAHLRRFLPFNGRYLAYEEDMDVCVIVAAFPDCFPADKVNLAHHVIATDDYFKLARV